jgi:CelD/BcsL family acetyltransferase involved in cellulose biosynthesis
MTMVPAAIDMRSGRTRSATMAQALPRLVAHREPATAQALATAVAAADPARRTPFQSARWLTTWAETVGKSGRNAPFLVHLDDGDTGRRLMTLPLALARQGSTRTITFWDEGVSDYNMPLMMAGMPGIDTAAAWKTIRSALPPADLILLDRMPADRNLNPLATLDGAARHSLSGNLIEVTNGFDDWFAGLERFVRKELRRCWRVFERMPDTRFVHVTDPAEGMRVLARLDTIQAARGATIGWTYILSDEPFSTMYERLVAEGLEDGSVVMTALMGGEEVVAALVGIAEGGTIAVTRLAAAGGEWAKASPGRLLLERTIRALAQKGITRFDFTIGSYDYKRRLGVRETALVEFMAPLSPLGWLVVSTRKARQRMRKIAWVRRIARRVRGTPTGVPPL